MSDAGAPTPTIVSVVRLVRPRHWVKNVFVFAALVFARRLTDPADALRSLAAFAAFCALSSGVYAINDVADADEDRLHPLKRRRPVAAGRIPSGAALRVAGACLAVGLALALTPHWPDGWLLVVGAAYVLLNLFYTFWAKRRMLLDVVCIAAGFVLRAVAGGVAIRVPVSGWLLACTFALCLFLALGKRRCEIARMGGAESAGSHRETLRGYTLPLLDRLLRVSGGVAVLAFLLYTLFLPAPYLFYSTPLVVYCVLRVAVLVESGRVCGPTDAVTSDVPFLVGFALWSAYAVGVVTWGS